jgi:hypothetical protein
LQTNPIGKTAKTRVGKILDLHATFKNSTSLQKARHFLASVKKVRMELVFFFSYTLKLRPPEFDYLVLTVGTEGLRANIARQAFSRI